MNPEDMNGRVVDVSSVKVVDLPLEKIHLRGVELQPRVGLSISLKLDESTQTNVAYLLFTLSSEEWDPIGEYRIPFDTVVNKRHIRPDLFLRIADLFDFNLKGDLRSLLTQCVNESVLELHLTQSTVSSKLECFVIACQDNFAFTVPVSSDLHRFLKVREIVKRTG